MNLSLRFKYLRFFLLIIILSFQNCTSWPGLIVLFLGGGGSKGSMLLIPPGGSSENPSNTNPTPAPPSNQDPTINSPPPTGPSVVSITSTKPSGYYKEGEVIDIIINFSEPVSATDPVTITLNNGTTVSCTAPTNSTSMTCTYTVGTGAGQDASPLEVVSVNGTLSNSNNVNISNASNLAGATPLSNDKLLTIDNTVPFISHVTSSTANGFYGAGANIVIQIVFNEVINVTGGTPSITLETGDPDRVASCTSGSGTNTLSCTYTVQAGDFSTDLDYVSTSSFNLNGATVTDLAGNTLVSSTLPVPSQTGSLSANKDIQIDGNAKTIQFASASSNGLESVTSPTVTVTISAAPSATVTVPYTVHASSSATGGGVDYTLANGTLTWNAGDGSSKTIAISVIDDALDEYDETIVIHLGSPSGPAALGGVTTHTYTILDDDNPPNVSFASATSIAAEEGGALSITIQLSAASGKNVTIPYSVGIGSTASPGDYSLTASPLVISAGNTSGTITLTPNNDSIDENNETVVIELGTPTNAGLGGITTHTVTIVDDDPLPTVAFASSSSNGSESTTSVNLAVTLSSASEKTVTVNYSATGGTATGGGVDYTLTSGTLTFSPGETSKNISFTVNNDTLDEDDETVIIQLASPTNADLGVSSHTYTIQDNDDPPTVSFSTSSQSVNENVMSGTATITINLSSVSGKVVTVPFSVSGTATGGGIDYSITASPVTISAGLTSTTITVNINNDSSPESNETVIVSMGTPTNATLGTNTTHTLTIVDDDTPNVNFSSATSNGAESTTTVNIAVNLSTASTVTVTVPFSINASSTATGSGTDYTLTTSSPLSFAPGETTKNISLTINNDSLDENNETIVIDLGTPTNANLGTITTHTYTINDDDDEPSISINSPSTTEGNSGTKNLSFTVSLSAASGKTITVDYSTADGTATTADNDYVAISTTTLTFNPGETSKTINVTINGDTKDEIDETFTINLASATNATIATASGTGTITNDDTPPTVQFVSTSSNSTNEASGNRTIALELSAVSGKNITVNITDLLTGSATQGSDYSAIATSVTFLPGETSKNLIVAVIDDTIYEGNETINLLLSSPTNATLGTNTTHTFTIVDDEIGIVSAETMDCNNNGYIDHYKLTFTANVTDSTFPGYALNSLGSTTTAWQVAGYSNVALRHGTAVNTACGVTDTANDSVIYISFSESGVYDTGAKPDLTTTASPGLSGPTGNVGQIFTASVAEADRAKPVVVSATGSTTSPNLVVTFSEPVYGTSGAPSCGSGGELSHTHLTYTNNVAGGGSSLVSMGTDNCATSDSNATFVANANFISADGDGTAPDDTVAASSTLYDAANNTGNTSKIQNLSISAGATPTITSIELYDPTGSGKITQLKVTFSLNMDDSTIDNADASRFTMSSQALMLVDRVTHDNNTSSAGGVILSPNNDPGTANDNIVTLFSDSSVVGTNLKTVAFSANTGRWKASSGTELASNPDLTSVTIDKAPPVILSAVANYVNGNLTVDAGDTLTITFSEATDKSITTANLSSVLTLSGGHSWGSVSSASWNPAGDVLTITFAGSGSTIAVGDYITIVNTLKDTASSPNESINKVSVAPITGSFGVDTTKPYLVYASDITTNSVVIQFSEAMNMTGIDATRADRIANYTIVEDPSNPGCTDITFTGGTLTVLSPTQVKIVLPGSSSFCNTNYKISVASTVTDLAGNTMGSPDYITFVGLEAIKVVSAQALTTNTIKITFSKPPLTGNNALYSAECNTTTECAKRYKITPTIGDGTITSAVVGSDPASYTVVVTHNGTQSGIAYTIIVANGQTGDNFDNAATECIKDIFGSSCVQQAPGDRATFVGSGSSCTTLACGAFFDDPFFDGTTFSFAFKYDNKIYLGTNDKNDAAFRFDPLGTNAILTTFKFINNAALSLSCASSIRFGYIISGITGGTCGTNGGANGEVGAVGFTSVELTIDSVNYEILAVGALKEAIDRVYYTQDKDTILDMKNFGTTGGNGINTASTQLIYGIDNYIFTGVASDHGTNAPVFNRAPVTAPGGVVTVGSVVNLNGSNIPYLGKQNGNPYNSGGNTVGIDFIYRVGNSTYMANNGGVIYISTSNMGTMAPSNNSQWNTLATLSTPSGITGTSLRLPNKNATNGGGLGKVRPGEKAYPYMLQYNGNLYLVRNVGTVADPRVPLRGELWKCTPNGNGQCAPSGWSKIVDGTETGLPANAKAISMLIANGNNLYLGFDDPVNGLVVYKHSGTNPGATGGNMSSVWTQQGSAGLGSGSKYIINSASIYDTATGKNYLYIVIGDGLGTTPIKVVRQLD